MKSEERHHLHENDLATAVDQGLKRAEPYYNQILIAVLVVAVLGIGFFTWRNAAGGAADEAWAAFAKADTADSFLTVADEHSKTPVANWARLRAAEQFLNQGLRTATSDRKNTEDNLKQAESTLQKLLQDKGATQPQIRERALYAMAVARETRSSGDTSAAIEAYKALTSEFPQSQYVTLAESRIKDLESETTREFYAWFDKQPRKPEDRPKPKELTGPLVPGSADPFILGDDPTDAGEPPRNPDRPPSPGLPSDAAETAPPFPGAAASPAPKTDSPAKQPAAESAQPSEPAKEPVKAEEPAASNPETDGAK
ncbi:MAG: hypothetical protein ACK5Q5_19620 [Planctomycetaceae bacterium]